jgi:thiamine pyrophosphokinase
LLGDFIAVSMPITTEKQYPIEIIKAPDQNKTDLEKAFDYLHARNICSKRGGPPEEELIIPPT